MNEATLRQHGMTRLWLLRHGEPNSEIRGRCYGRRDAGLSDEGRWQCERSAQELAREKFSALYSSPTLRAQESAAILARGRRLDVIVEEPFREIDFGDFEGMAYDEIAKRYADLYSLWMTQPTKVCFPNGESFAGMKRRVLRAVRRLLDRHAGETIALVSHGGVNRIVLAWALGMQSKNVFRIGQGYAARNLIVQIDDAYIVERMNQLAES